MISLTAPQGTSITELEDQIVRATTVPVCFESDGRAMLHIVCPPEEVPLVLRDLERSKIACICQD